MFAFSPGDTVRSPMPFTGILLLLKCTCNTPLFLVFSTWMVLELVNSQSEISSLHEIAARMMISSTSGLNFFEVFIIYGFVVKIRFIVSRTGLVCSTT